MGNTVCRRRKPFISVYSKNTEYVKYPFLTGALQLYSLVAHPHSRLTCGRYTGIYVAVSKKNAPSCSAVKQALSNGAWIVSVASTSAEILCGNETTSISSKNLFFDFFFPDNSLLKDFN